MSDERPGPAYDPLFRREAVEEYLRGREHGRLLAVSPLWSVWAFGLLVLAFASAVVFAALARVGTDVEGQAIVRWAPDDTHRLVVACLLPDSPEAFAAAGRTVTVSFDAAPARRFVLQAGVSGPTLVTPGEVPAMLGPDAAPVAVVRGPVVLVHAGLPPDAGLVPGATGRAWVRVGETSLLRVLLFAKAGR